jgi:hypothetical protein
VDAEQLIEAQYSYYLRMMPEINLKAEQEINNNYNG